MDHASSSAKVPKAPADAAPVTREQLDRHCSTKTSPAKYQAIIACITYSPR